MRSIERLCKPAFRPACPSFRCQPKSGRVIGGLVLREARHNPVTQSGGSATSQRPRLLPQAAIVLTTPWARVVLATVFLEGLLVFGPLAFIPAHLHEHFGLSLTTAGLLMAAFGLGGLAYISLARWFVRRFGEVGLAASGGILLSAAWLLLAQQSSWVLTPLAAFTAGLGYYQLHNTLQTNATQMAPAVRGTAVSLFASAFFLGQSLGVVLAAQVFTSHGHSTLFLGAASLTPVLAAGFAGLLERQRHKLHSQGGSAKN